MFYRFNNGIFIEAETFPEAQQKFIDIIKNETETKDGWHQCACVGFNHRYDCEYVDDNVNYIPF